VTDLRDNPELGWNLLLGVSVVGIVVAGWYGFYRAPAPSRTAAYGKESVRVAAATRRAQEAASSNLASVRARTWNVDLDTLGSTALNQLTVLTQKHGVQLSGFRTERAVDVATLKEAPMVANVEGKFLDVVSFVQSLEKADSKLAVNLLQVSASETAPGQVTATLGLVGFVFKEEKQVGPRI